MEKQCSKCGEPKPLDQFDRQPGGKFGVRAMCKSCVKIYMSDYAKRNRSRLSSYNLDRSKKARRMVYEYLKRNPCVDCGEDRVAALQFDHVRGAKEYNVSNMVQRSFSLDKIRSEIEKCEVRCANCHAVRTSEQFHWYSGLE